MSRHLDDISKETHMSKRSTVRTVTLPKANASAEPVQHATIAAGLAALIISVSVGVSTGDYSSVPDAAQIALPPLAVLGLGYGIRWASGVWSPASVGQVLERSQDAALDVLIEMSGPDGARAELEDAIARRQAAPGYAGSGTV